MTSRFERDFYKASVYQASVDLLMERGTEKPTFCQVLEIIKAERRKTRTLPPSVSPIDEKASLIMAYEIRRILGKPLDHQLSNREYKKGLTAYKKDLKRRKMVFRPFSEAFR